MVTRGAAREDAIARLRGGGDDSARLDADVLLAHALGISKESLYAHLDVPLADAEAARFGELVERRLEGVPVAYLRGWKEFYGLRLAVDPRVLIPRPETEVLVEAALAYLRATGGTRVADVGTGSGAVAIAIAIHAPGVKVVATDLATSALTVARSNIAAHAVADRVELREGDLLGPVEGKVDVVTANLPYLSVARGPSAPGVGAPGSEATLDTARRLDSIRFEPREAVLAGPDGLDVIRRCVAQLPAKLEAGGAAFFECDPPQAEEVAALLRSAIGARVRIHPDLTGAARVVEGVRP